jgi:exodeoxyribonuclease VII large subunit
MSEIQASGMSEESRPYSVGEFTERLNAAVKKWPTAWVEGELIKFKVNYSGHAYPTLRDLDGNNAVIDLTIFANVLNASGEQFKDSDRVIVSGSMDFYQPSGKLSLRVTSIKKVGLGDLLAQLEALRAKLRAEGVIDESKRQPLPFLPKRIGLITGKDSDAEKDVLKNVLERWPDAKFSTIHVPVQGEASPAAVVDAIQKLDAEADVEVIIIARGGGAFLDLIGFSDERVVRAAAKAKTPIVSAIGHEADRPILDDVADYRASTPTDAAKNVVPDVAEERLRINDALMRMMNRIGHYIAVQSDFLAQLVSRPIMANPMVFVDEKQQDMDRALDAIRDSIERTLEREQATQSISENVLRSLSPQSTLDRGYSVVRDAAGHVVADGSKVKTGTKLNIRLAKGQIEATSN